MENEQDILRKFIKESLIEEGVMDWLFSRWRKGGHWKGNRTKGDIGILKGLQADLQTVYSTIDSLRSDYPRATKRIRDNVRRIILDLEHINSLISQGIDEKSFLKGELD